MLDDGSFGDVPPSWRTPLATISAKLSEITGIVDDLLLASPIQAGAIPVQRQRADLRDLVREAIPRAAPRGELLRATLDATLQDEPIPLDVDRTSDRVLDNLINNAFTYSHRPLQPPAPARR